jgi:hypothetical protein
MRSCDLRNLCQPAGHVRRNIDADYDFVAVGMIFRGNDFQPVTRYFVTGTSYQHTSIGGQVFANVNRIAGLAHFCACRQREA